MATVTGYTAAKMAEFYNASVVAARRVVDNIVLTTRGGVDIDLGSFKGDTGVGTPGPAWAPQVLTGAAGTVDWNTLTTPGLYPALMHGSTNPNGPGAIGNGFYYVMVYAYTGASGNVTQIAEPYQEGYPPFYRVRYSSSWGAWRMIRATPATAIPDGAWYRGKMAASPSHTTSMYKSYLFGTKDSGENLAVGTSGDCLIPPAGVFDVSTQVEFTNSGTGYRRIYLIVNPALTAYNNVATAPTGTIIGEAITPGIAGSTTALAIPPKRYRFNGTTDKVMTVGWQDSTGAMTIPSNAYQSDMNLAYVGP